jgi:hypothetical protein
VLFNQLTGKGDRVRKRSILLLLICVFIAGVFVGIWMAWRVWKEMAGVQHIVYQVQDFQEANVVVKGGDIVSLEAPPGGSGAGLLMDFHGYGPCKNKAASNPCEIDPNAPAASYFFTCSSNAGYNCPDPGVQQSPTTGPLQGLSYGGAVMRSFAHLVGAGSSTEEKPKPDNGKVNRASASPIKAIVRCDDNNATYLQGTDGSKLQTIKPANGQSVFWISNQSFTLDTHNFPAQFCSNGNPNGTFTPQNGNNAQAQCNVNTSGQIFSYTVMGQTCTAPPLIAAVNQN